MFLYLTNLGKHHSFFLSSSLFLPFALFLFALLPSSPLPFCSSLHSPILRFPASPILPCFALSLIHYLVYCFTEHNTRRKMMGETSLATMVLERTERYGTKRVILYKK